MKMQLQIPLEYGLLFLSDPYSDDEVPSDTGAASVTYTQTCIAIQAPSYVDGEADITLSNAEFPGKGDIIFNGSITVSSKVMALSDPNRFNYCMVPLKDSNPIVMIWEHWEQGGRKIWISLSNIELF